MKNNKIKILKERFATWREGVSEKQRNGWKDEKEDVQSLETHTCLNCGNTYQGNYCPQCGQSADAKRFSVKSVMKNLFSALLGSEAVFLPTCAHLLFRPGYMFRDFLVGKRMRYFRPVQLLLFLVTIYALLSYAFKSSYTPWLASDFSIDDDDVPSVLQQASNLIGKFLNNKVASSLTSAFVSVFPYQWLFRRCSIMWQDGVQRRLNIAEQFYTLVYLSCQGLLIGFLFFFISIFMQDNVWLDRIEMLLPFFFVVWSYRQLYQISWMKSLVRNFVATSLAFILLILLLIIYFGCYYGFTAIVKG